MIPPAVKDANTNRRDQGLAKRLTFLIQSFHRGNKKAAALAMGVNPSTVYRIAEGETKTPTADIIASIADFYGIDPQWLLSGEGMAPTARSIWGTLVRREVRRLRGLADTLELSLE